MLFVRSPESPPETDLIFVLACDIETHFHNDTGCSIANAYVFSEHLFHVVLEVRLECLTPDDFLSDPGSVFQLEKY